MVVPGAEPEPDDESVTSLVVTGSAVLAVAGAVVAVIVVRKPWCVVDIDVVVKESVGEPIGEAVVESVRESVGESVGETVGPVVGENAGLPDGARVGDGVDECDGEPAGG